jgi:hypothetical protein
MVNKCEVCINGKAEGKPAAVRYRGIAGIKKVCKKCRQEYAVDTAKDKRELFGK